LTWLRSEDSQMVRRHHRRRTDGGLAVPVGSAYLASSQRTVHLQPLPALV
jgi:hypothetical protein